jgi:hypothetical protein
MNAIRSFEAEYLVSSFFRDLPTIRQKTFTVPTIKHAFANSGIWPVSFKAVKKKLKEYGKKSKKDTGLDFLEFGSESESESEWEDRELERDPIPDPTLTEEYRLPELKPPSSYNECQALNEELAPKLRALASSPTRAKYDLAHETTNMFLMRGSINEMEILQARAGQVEAHKKRLSARKSLAKGGSLLASVALTTMAEKRRKEADEVLRKANLALIRAQNKQKEELRQLGVADRRQEQERKKYIQQHQALGSQIPNHMWTTIRDRQKEPTTDETEACRIALQSLYDAVAKAQHDKEEAYTANPISFTSIPIDPIILEEERKFQLSQRGGIQVTIPVDSEGEEEGEEEGVEEGEEGDKYDEMEDYRSVVSLDSIVENADFVSLE